MAEVVLYGNATCPYCMAARMLLKKKGVDFEDIGVHTEPGKRDEMIERSGRTSVPQIFINGRHIGGFDELDSLDKDGELDELLGEN